MRFIALGADCQPAYQIRRLRGETIPLFFDWLVTPIRSVMPLIESGFADAFTPERLIWSRNRRPHRAMRQRTKKPCNPTATPRYPAQRSVIA